MHTKSKKAFTLIELLTVIAIIGILAAILIPTVGAAKTSALKAKTKVQFNQWATAMSLFKQEYGYFPQVDGGGGNKVNTTALAKKFAGALTGKDLVGTKLAAGDANLTGNIKILSFYSMASNELSDATTSALLVDAFGNTDIAVLYDKDGDGMITSADATAPTVKGIDATSAVTPNFTLSATSGPRVGAAFYSAGKGVTATDIVYSWQ